PQVAIHQDNACTDLGDALRQCRCDGGFALVRHGGGEADNPGRGGCPVQVCRELDRTNCFRKTGKWLLDNARCDACLGRLRQSAGTWDAERPYVPWPFLERDQSDTWELEERFDLTAGAESAVEEVAQRTQPKSEHQSHEGCHGDDQQAFAIGPPDRGCRRRDQPGFGIGKRLLLNGLAIPLYEVVVEDPVGLRGSFEIAQDHLRFIRSLRLRYGLLKLLVDEVLSLIRDGVLVLIGLPEPLQLGQDRGSYPAHGIAGIGGSEVIAAVFFGPLGFASGEFQALRPQLRDELV